MYIAKFSLSVLISSVAGTPTCTYSIYDYVHIGGQKHFQESILVH